MAAPTALSVTTDRDEYSRYETTRNSINLAITPTGIGTSGELILIELIKARFNRDAVVASKTITLTANPYTLAALPLTDIVDSQQFFPKVRRGSYFVRVTSVTNTLIIGNTVDFLVSLITLDKLKRDYLHGANSRAFDQLMVHSQPALITGVTVTGVSQNHPQGWFSLSYNFVDPGDDAVAPFIRTLSWCHGPSVVIDPTVLHYTLRAGSGNAYIDVDVNAGALPGASISEELLIERTPLADESLRSHLNEAISWVEKVALSVFLEPTRVVTEIDQEATVSFPAGSTIPTLTSLDVDERVDALTHHQPAAGHWINIKVPYYPLIRIDELYGKLANTRVINIAPEWIEIHEKTGWTELVPIGQNSTFNFIGLQLVSFIRSAIPLPNFWNFKAIVGFRQTPAVLLELVAKKAAIDILTIAGLALRGGVASTSLSRDGISESISYTTSAQFGVYNAAIQSYKMWMDDQLPRLRGAFKGPTLTAL